ncbi:GEM-like protein 4 [Morella rubra]|uniref:GEM-like protein 4 n=1 Tax=Morella rubra TaxID=262757 RepID=A0A6A1VKJ7_9ROSI|nr:GEM-like protein 4 [Morella rubra]
MKTTLQQLVLGTLSSAAYRIDYLQKRRLGDSASQHHIPSLENGADSVVLNWKNKHGKKGDHSFAHGVREHVRHGPKITETMKGKLRMGARILRVGGVDKIFKRFFSLKEGEKLLKASQCCLSTTAGPIAGLLFISTEKVAFCSEKSIKISSPNGEMTRVHYKVSIPLRRIKRTDQSENVKKPSEKYIEIVTVDNFDFWFMGFLNYKKAFKYLQEAISKAN